MLNKVLIVILLFVSCVSFCSVQIGAVTTDRSTTSYNDMSAMTYANGATAPQVSSGVSRTTYRTSVGIPWALPAVCDGSPVTPCFIEDGYLIAIGTGQVIYKVDLALGSTTHIDLSATSMTDVDGVTTANGSVFFAECPGAPAIQKIIQTSTGWLVTIGDIDGAADGSVPCGFILHKDSGGTWTIRARVVEGATRAIFRYGSLYLCGVYAELAANSTTYGIPMLASVDEGLTWSEVWNEGEVSGTAKAASGTTKHVHYMNQLSTNEFWFQYGDSANAMIRAVTRPTDWTGPVGDKNTDTGIYDDTDNLWDFNTSVNSTGTVSIYGVGPTGIIGSDAYFTSHTGFDLSESMFKINTTTYKATPLRASFWIPTAADGTTYYDADAAVWTSFYGCADADTYGLSFNNGTYRYQRICYADDIVSGVVGSYVAKTPADQFAAAIRYPRNYLPDRGSRDLQPALYSNDKHYIGRTQLEARAHIQCERSLAYVIAPSTAKNVQMDSWGTFPSNMYITNSGAGSVYTVSDDRVFFDPVRSLYSFDTTNPLFGTQCLKLTADETGVDFQGYFYFNDEDGVNVTAGKYYTLSFWARADVPAGKIAKIVIYTSPAEISARTRSFRMIGEEWRRISVDFILDSVPTSFGFRFDVIYSDHASMTLPELQAAPFYMDGVMLTEHADGEFRLNSVPFEAGDSAVPEYHETTISNATTAWTAMFDWWPDEATDDMRYSATGTTYIPIATWRNASDYLTLRWNKQDGDFELYDGTNTTTLTPDVPIKWQHDDCLKFAIVNASDGASLYVYSPTNFYCSRFATEFHDAWSASSVSYVIGNIVSNDSLPYVCILDNTSAAGNEPGTTGGAEEWQLIDDGMLLTVSGTANCDTAPDEWVLGADNAKTLTGCGAVGNLSITDEILDYNQILDDWKSETDITITTPGAVYKGGMYGN